MEPKEHVFLMLLLLAKLLPIVTANDLFIHKGACKIAPWVAGLIVPLSLSMEGAGAVISIAEKVGLLFKGQEGR